MSTHAHEWWPTQGERAQYDCACGATGYRSHRRGIVEHKKPREREEQLTVGHAQGELTGDTRDGNRRVLAKELAK